MILLKNAHITDPNSPHNGSKVDLLIEDGRITQLAPNLQKEVEQVLDCEGWIVSPGWCDLLADFCEPGLEFRETIETGSKAAVRGGFTSVGISPATVPVIDNRSQVEYILGRNKTSPVNLLPAGALSKGLNGKELSEMSDMANGGAVAFTEGGSLDDSGLLLRALQYGLKTNKTVLSFANDEKIRSGAQVHEGEVNVQLGMKGWPALAEELAIERNLQLVRYTGGRLHFNQLSSAKGVELIKKAKQEGLNVTASVSPYHLVFYESALLEFDTNFKISPPLRDETDRLALIKGLQEGSIDTITSAHMPRHSDDKDIDFVAAAMGISGIESCFSTFCTHLADHFSPEDWVQFVGYNAREILSLAKNNIEEGSAAELTIFSDKKKTLFSEENWVSKSKNNPFLGQELQGQVLAIVNKGRLYINH